MMMNVDKRQGTKHFASAACSINDIYMLRWFEFGGGLYKMLLRAPTFLCKALHSGVRWPWFTETSSGLKLPD